MGLSTRRNCSKTGTTPLCRHLIQTTTTRPDRLQSSSQVSKVWRIWCQTSSPTSKPIRLDDKIINCIYSRANVPTAYQFVQPHLKAYIRLCKYHILNKCKFAKCTILI